MKTSLNRKCILYRRHSSKGQSQGDSQRRQLQLATNYAMKNGHYLDTSLSYQDIAISAKSSSNLSKGQLGQFLIDCKSGRIQSDINGVKPLFLVEHFDRISRDAITSALQMVLEILDYVDIVTLSDSKIYTKEADVTDILTMIIFMAKAHDENTTRAKRVKEAKDRKTQAIATSGIKVTSQGPFYCKLSECKTKWIVDEDRADIVRLIFDRIVDKGIGLHRILTELNEQGLKSPRNSTWSLSTVQSLVKSPRCIGHFTDKDGNLHKGYYPKIVDEDTYYAAQAIRSKRSKGSSGPSSKGFPNLLKGIAVCGSCGGNLHYVAKGSTNNYLVCSNARQGKGCTYHSYRYAKTESFITTILSCLNYSDMSGVNATQAIAEVEKLNQAITLKQQSIDNLVEAISSAESPIIIKSLTAKIDKLGKALEVDTALLSEKEYIVSSVKSNNPDEQFKQFDATKDRPAINEFYKRHIQKITFKTDGLQIQFTGQHWRLSLSWEQEINPNTLMDFFNNRELEELPDDIDWNFLAF